MICGPHTVAWLQFMAWDQEARNKVDSRADGGAGRLPNSIVAHEFLYNVSMQARIWARCHALAQKRLHIPSVRAHG